MFDNRCMYYLTIVVVMLFSVSFIKLNKFWELDVRYGEVESDESMGTTIFKGVRFLIGTINEQISNFAQSYPANSITASIEAPLLINRYRFVSCSCFSCFCKKA